MKHVNPFVRRCSWKFMNIYVKNVIHFGRTKTYLTAANVQYTLNPRLVRGLDYYTKQHLRYNILH